MITFGIDTAGRTVGVALMRDGQLLYDCYLDAGLTHSETLMNLVDAAFQSTGLSPADVQLWGVCSGPGSFTGLRIGIAAVKGWPLLRVRFVPRYPPWRHWHRVLWAKVPL